MLFLQLLSDRIAWFMAEIVQTGINKDVLNSEGLIQQFDICIEKTVQYFINKGQIEYCDKDDYCQHVREKLLLKTSKIIENFKGESSLKTYVITIIRNICKDEINRRNKMHLHLTLNEEVNQDESLDPVNKIIIQQEVLKLKRILITYPKSRQRVDLCLKLKFRIPFFFIDFVKYNKDVNKIDYSIIKSKLKEYPNVTDEKIYIALNWVFNKYESKSKSADALRKWIKQRIVEIIYLLNKNSRSLHNEESFQILFEYYISNEQLKD